MPIAFSGIRTAPQTRGVTMPKIQKDTFVKNNNINFKGTKSSFEKWMEENNLTLSDIKNIISNNENILGAGFDNTTFSIPDCDEYVLRVRSNLLSFVLNSDFENATIINTEDKNLDINIGQQVAEILPKTIIPFPAGIEVLKKQYGESVGVQPSETIQYGEIEYEDYQRKNKYARTIHKVASLPIESYETLITEIKKAEELGYTFDHLNSNNLLVDENNQRINIIDMEKRGKRGDTMANLLYALTNIRYYSTYTSQTYCPVSDNERHQAYQDSMEIIGKFAQAMKNQGLKFDREFLSYEAGLFLFSSSPFMGACEVRCEADVWESLKDFGIA